MANLFTTIPFLVGVLIGGMVVFIGYDQISKIIPGFRAKQAYKRGYFTNHLNIYPFRPASLY